MVTQSSEVPPLVLQGVLLQQFFKNQHSAGRKLSRRQEPAEEVAALGLGQGLGHSNPCTARHKWAWAWAWAWEWVIITHISLLTKVAVGSLRALRTVGR